MDYFMMQDDCVFCRIIRGELPSWKIMETNDTIGILDNTPSAKGHCLVIPKRHVPTWHELSDKEVSAVFNAAKLVAKQIKEKYKPDFVCIFVRGGRVKHTHVVLVPSHEGDALSGFPQSALGKAEIDFAEVQKCLQIK